MTPGQILYHAWHRPYGHLRSLWLDGGPGGRRRTEAGRAEMEAAAATLPPPPVPDSAPPLAVHLLTGGRFWYQTAFCLWSLARLSARRLHPAIFDDGTLTPQQSSILQHLFPHTRIIPSAESEARLDQILPASHYPSLRRRRTELPLMRKILDVHAGSTGCKLFLDSDLLFFKRPALLLDWHDTPATPLHGHDIDDAYGFPLPALDQLAGTPVPRRVNTGTLGLDSASIDWDRMEYWCLTLESRFRPHYYQEQALIALHLAGRPCTVAPPRDYVVLPRPPEAIHCRAIMHHYVAHSKRWYYRHNWRKVLAS